LDGGGLFLLLARICQICHRYWLENLNILYGTARQ
jgi:hypothetical protein